MQQQRNQQQNSGLPTDWSNHLKGTFITVSPIRFFRAVFYYEDVTSVDFTLYLLACRVILVIVDYNQALSLYPSQNVLPRLFPDASLVRASARVSRSATQVAPLEISNS